VSEEENLPTAEEMRARHADLMTDEAAEPDESAVGSPPSAEPEPEPEPEPEAAEPVAEEPAPVAEEAPADDGKLPSPEEMRARYADLMKDEEPAPARDTSTAPEPVDEAPDSADDLAAHLLDVNVRFWAELGRTRLPLAQTVALGTGAIVDLDTEPDDELDVLVNGMPFAKGKLLLVDGEWAIRLERIVATPAAVEQASSSGSGA